MIKLVSSLLSKTSRTTLLAFGSMGVIVIGAGGLAAYRTHMEQGLYQSTVKDKVNESNDGSDATVGSRNTHQSTGDSNSQSANKDTAKTPSSTAGKSATKKPVSEGASGSGGATSTGSTGGSSPPTSTNPGCPNVTHTPGGSDGTGGCWPYAANTGVPAGASLGAYGGPCSIQEDTVITNKIVNCALQMYNDSSLTIRNSIVNGFVENTYTSGVGKLLIEDSEIRAGAWVDGAVWGSSLTVKRTEITGGQHSVHCESNCTIVDSWLHNQYNPDGGSYHNNAFLSNGGTNMVLTHNTLHCTAILNETDGGCTSDLTLLGDFDVISYVTAKSNLMMANNSSIAFCVVGGYAPSKPYPIAHHIVMQDNVFQRGQNGKCGVYGAVTSFQTSATGNVWSGNKWSDGAVVDP